MTDTDKEYVDLASAAPRIRRFRIRRLALLLGLWASVGVPGSFDSAVARSPQLAATAGSRAVVPGDMAPALNNGRDESEFWNYHLFLGDSLRIHLSLFRTHLPFPVGRVVGCELSILGLTEEPHNVVRRFSEERFHWSPGTEGELRIHPDISVHGSPIESQQLSFATTKDGVRTELEISITSIENGRIYDDGNLFRSPVGQVVMLPLIARARVQGVVRLDDEERQVDGTAYMDHVYFTTRPERLLTDVYQLIDHREPWTVGVIYGISPRAGGGRQGLWLTRRGEGARITPTDAIDILEMRRFQDMDLPTKLRVEVGRDSSLLLSRTPDQRFSALDSVGFFARLLFRAFVGGEMIMMRGNGVRAGRPYAYNYIGIE